MRPALLSRGALEWDCFQPGKQPPGVESAEFPALSSGNVRKTARIAAGVQFTSVETLPCGCPVNLTSVMPGFPMAVRARLRD